MLLVQSEARPVGDFSTVPEGAVTAPPQGHTSQHAGTPQLRVQSVTYLGRGVREAASDMRPWLRDGVGEDID